MQAAIALLNTLLPIGYAVVAMSYSIEFFRQDPFAKRVNVPLLGGLVGLHAVYLGLRMFLYQHIPLASFYEVLTSIAFALAVVYLIIETTLKDQRTGMFVLTFGFGFQTVASAFMTDTFEFPEVLRSPLFGVHTGAAVLGYTSFAVSAIYGVLYLLLYHDLKASRFGLVYQRLPSLDVLARMSLQAAVMGVVFLTTTISIGILWAAQKFPGFHSDPKFVTTVIVWLVYVGAIASHYGLKWDGRRTIYVSLFGFVFMVLSMFLVQVLPSFHGFA